MFCFCFATFLQIECRHLVISWRILVHAVSTCFFCNLVCSRYRPAWVVIILCALDVAQPGSTYSANDTPVSLGAAAQLLPSSCLAVPRQLPGSWLAAAWKLSGSCPAAARQLPGSCQQLPAVSLAAARELFGSCPPAVGQLRRVSVFVYILERIGCLVWSGVAHFAVWGMVVEAGSCWPLCAAPLSVPP